MTARAVRAAADVVAGFGVCALALLTLAGWWVW